jgi:hypothetical protein
MRGIIAVSRRRTGDPTVIVAVDRGSHINVHDHRASTVPSQCLAADLLADSSLGGSRFSKIWIVSPIGPLPLGFLTDQPTRFRFPPVGIPTFTSAPCSSLMYAAISRANIMARPTFPGAIRAAIERDHVHPSLRLRDCWLETNRSPQASMQNGGGALTRTRGSPRQSLRRPAKASKSGPTTRRGSIGDSSETADH